MKAVVCHKPEGLHGLAFSDIEPPALSTPDGIRIRVAAAGLNFADTLMMRAAYQVKPAPPFVAGKELAGEVTEIGTAVHHVRVGDRVMAIVEWGAFAEEIVVAERNVFLLSDGLDDIKAAGFPIVYGTAHFGLADRAQLRAGETVVVFGATGGVGLTSVEVARGLGARVIAVVGGEKKRTVALDHGADETIDHTSEDVAGCIRDLTDGAGANVFVDPVGGAMFDLALKNIVPGGRILIVGFAGGRIPQIPANRLLVKNVAAIGFTIGAWQQRAPERVKTTMAELVGWAEAGTIRPHVSMTFPLADFACGYNALMRRETTGKVVFTL